MQNLWILQTIDDIWIYLTDGMPEIIDRMTLRNRMSVGWDHSTNVFFPTSLCGDHGVNGEPRAPFPVDAVVAAALCVAGVALGDIHAVSNMTLSHTILSRTSTHNLSHLSLSHVTLSHATLSNTTFAHNFFTHLSLTHNFVTHNCDTHTTLSHTQTQLCHTIFVTHNSFAHNIFTHISLAHNFVTHNFVTHNLWLCHTPAIFHTQLCHN